MKAILLKKFGNENQLQIETVPTPKPQPNEVLVRVKAFSINSVDVKTRKGEALASLLKNKHHLILGWDISGVIQKVGDDVSNFTVGAAVFGMVNFVGHGKAYAEYVTVPANQIAEKPNNISHAEAAASCLAALTAWQAFTYFGKLQKNDIVLIHAASGGVGHFAIQIANYIGAKAIGTASAKNRNFILSLGAKEHIDYKTVNFEEKLNNIDFVLETIGTENFKNSVKVLKEGGTIVNLPSGLTESDKKAAKYKKLKACFFMSVYSSGEDMHEIARLLQNKTIKPYIFKNIRFQKLKKPMYKWNPELLEGKLLSKFKLIGILL